MMDLTLSSPAEIVTLLCDRLRKERLAKQMTQADVAARAGLASIRFQTLKQAKMWASRIWSEWRWY